MMTNLNLSFSQKGLAYFPDYAVYCTYYINGYTPENYTVWQEIAKAIEEFCAQTDYQTVALQGVGFELWTAWSQQRGYTLPQGMGSKYKLDAHSRFVGNTGGDLWYHIKSNNAEDADRLQQIIHSKIQAILSPEPLHQPLIVPAEKRYNGKVLGGRFTDGLENPADHEDLSERVVIGGEDASHMGGAFLLSQMFVHDWTMLNAMTELEKENMIGRDRSDRIIPMEDESSHIKRVRQLNRDRINFRLVRQALPYGHKTDNKANERGVFFAAYAKSTNVFNHVLDGIAGNQRGFVQDQLFSVTRSHIGSMWYVPSLKECGLQPGAGNEEVTMNEYFNVRSKNGYMFYNARDYQHKIRSSKLTEDCPLSDRILGLLNKQFSRWQDTWYKKRETPPLGHLKDHLAENEQHLLTASIALRKGKAVQLSLSKVLISPEYSKRANLMLIDPDEIIVGNMPQLSLGIGTQVMEYLTDDERMTGFFATLNEYSATGHNAPNYPLLVEKGIDAIAQMYAEKRRTAPRANKDFYQSVVWALDGLSKFIEAYAKLARRMAKNTKTRTPQEVENLLHIAERMEKIAHQKPETFAEGLQLVFITNCALHQTGEPMSIGRLDQQLIELLRNDIANNRLTLDAAQEMIDAFWLKMDETVLYNYNHLNDYLTYGTGAVFYSAGNFPQGAAINQWVQQLTVGGYKANDAAEPEDASNEITVMCLRAARRLPMNAPCLSLRVHKNMSDELFEEAAKVVLSGGAHPIMLNDDKLVPALSACGPLSVADARDYTCDGCYEPVIVGKTEWAFSYVTLLPLVGLAMNQGATISGAGPINLRGLKTSWNSPPPEEILSFEQFMNIFYTHWRWAMNGFFNSLMNGYGDLWSYCPSPLFSAFLDDTLETGRDLSNGGARYHIVAPMMCGIANTINSLYAIKQLVYDESTARCSLPQLLLCLQCDWGNNMTAPFYTTLEGKLRRDEDAQFFQQLRQYALQVPKFGIGKNDAFVEFAKEFVGNCVNIIHDCFNNPLPIIKQNYENLQKKYGTPERPFAFTVTPGVGTFEDNVGLGAGIGASPDGRLNGQPIADDFSAQPSPADMPIDKQMTNAFVSLQDWNIEPINHGIANAAPIDLNIEEDFPLDKLTELIRDFAHGKLGSNMITITCADTSTYQGAAESPERYDLVRVRMGGWSEFFVSMFDFHQNFIMRRPYYTYKDPA